MTDGTQPPVVATRVIALAGAAIAVWMALPLNEHAVLPWFTAFGLVVLYGASAALAAGGGRVASRAVVFGVALHALFGLAHAAPVSEPFGVLCVAPLFVANRLGHRATGWFGSLLCVCLLAFVVYRNNDLAQASTVALRWTLVVLVAGMLMGSFAQAERAARPESNHGAVATAPRSEPIRPVVPSPAEVPHSSVPELHALRHAARSFHHLSGVILTSAEIVRDDLRDAGMAGGDLDVLVRKANEASALAVRLLTVARDDTTDSGRFEVGPFLASLQSDVSAIAGPQIDVDVKVLPGLAPLHMDATQLADILFELVRNAVEAMQGRGHLTLAAYVDGSVPAGCMRIVVEDNGPGMCDATRAQAFQPFYSTRTDVLGSGLGLSVVRSAVRRNGGQVRIETGRAGGVQVVLDLPVVPAGDGIGRTGGVVVVGSDDGCCGVVASMLRDAGFTVRFVVDPGQTLQALSLCAGVAELVLLEGCHEHVQLANLLVCDWQHIDVVWLGRPLPELSRAVRVLNNVPVYAVVDELMRISTAA